MNRADFQRLADIRIEEAAVLLAQHKWDGAYYLAGYAAECALKACIAKQINQYDFPPPRKVVEDCYSHELEKLVKQAGLELQRNTDASANVDFRRNWLVATAWNESSRYKFWDQTQAEKLYNAVADPPNGVLPWLKKYW